jgi:diaminopimelate decarboxylase
VFGGVPLAGALDSLRTLDPSARAAWIYDLEAFEARASRFRAAFAPLSPCVGLALKSNALPALLEVARAAGLGAEAGSLGELTLAEALGFPAAVRVLNGNGRTPEEAEWVAERGVHSVNADHLGELDLLENAAAAAGARLRVALRINPSIDAGGHPYVATGGEDAKFGVAPGEALEAWAARARWPHLVLDGLHLHVGSQLLDLGPLERAVETALGLAAESAARGAPLRLINLGGGYGVDYSGAAEEFPIESYAAWLVKRVAGLEFDWVFEPGRWLTAPVGALLAEVVAVKRRGARRFVVLSAGMNDLLRPALYGASHRVVPLRPRPGEATTAAVVGPVCESADVFHAEILLPPLEPGDPVALLDAGAYGSAMSSNYNGRGRLAELTARGGVLRRARSAETPQALLERRTDDPLPAPPR